MYSGYVSDIRHNTYSVAHKSLFALRKKLPIDQSCTAILFEIEFHRSRCSIVTLREAGKHIAKSKYPRAVRKRPNRIAHTD